MHLVFLYIVSSDIKKCTLFNGYIQISVHRLLTNKLRVNGTIIGSCSWNNLLRTLTFFKVAFNLQYLIKIEKGVKPIEEKRFEMIGTGDNQGTSLGQLAHIMLDKVVFYIREGIWLGDAIHTNLSRLSAMGDWWVGVSSIWPISVIKWLNWNTNVLSPL